MIPNETLEQLVEDFQLHTRSGSLAKPKDKALDWNADPLKIYELLNQIWKCSIQARRYVQLLNASIVKHVEIQPTPVIVNACKILLFKQVCNNSTASCKKVRDIKISRLWGFHLKKSKKFSKHFSEKFYWWIFRGNTVAKKNRRISSGGNPGTANASLF